MLCTKTYIDCTVKYGTEQVLEAKPMTKDVKKISISDALYDAIKTRAQERHLTVEEYVECLLEKALTKGESKTDANRSY